MRRAATRRGDTDRHDLFLSASGEQRELVLEWAVDGTILFCNRAHHEFFGWTDDVVGHNLDELYEWEPGTDREQRLATLMSAAGVDRNTRIYRDGRVVEWADTPVRDADGAVCAVFSVGRDITDRVRAEAALRDSELRTSALLANVSDLVVLADAAGTILDSSGRYRPFLDHEPGTGVGRNLFDLIHPDDVDAFRRIVHGLVSDADGAEATVEARVVDATGSYVWHEITVANRLGDPLVRALVLTVRNVERRKNVEQELEARRREAEAQLRQRITFVAQLSHELRNPLNGLLGFSEILHNADLPPHLADAAEAAFTLTRTMRRTVEDLLDAVQIDLGQLRVRHHPVDVGAVVDSAVQVARQLAQTGVTVVAAPVPERLRHIVSDADRLRQALANLLSNACKHTPSGEIRVEVTAGSGPGMVRFRVLDTGTGVAPSDVPRLFQLFERGNDVARTDPAGVGLGLAIVKGIAAALGGDAWAAARGGGGAEFWFEVQANDDATGQLPRPALDADGAAPVTRPGRVLIVDDEPSNRLLARYVLQDLTDDLLEAPDGTTALRIVEEQPVDVMIVDMQLPDMDGCEVTRRVRSLAARQPVIAIWSGNTGSDAVRAAIDAGADTFLGKPANIHDLELLLQLHHDDEGSSIPSSPQRFLEAAGVAAMQEQPLLRTTLDSLMDPHLLARAVRDEAGRVIDMVVIQANAAAATYFDLRLEQLVGMRFGERFDGQMLRGLLHWATHVVDRDEPLVVDGFESMSPDGPTGRYLDLRGVKIGDSLSVTWRDVTERHRAAIALAESEERFRLMAEYSSDVVFSSDGDGRVSWISPTLPALVGWPVDSFIGHRVEEFAHPDDLATLYAGRERAIDADNRAASYRLRIRTIDGDHRWMAVRLVVMLDESGNVVGRVGSWRDIDAEVAATDALTASQGQYRLLAEHASDVVYQRDAEGVIRWISPSVEEILGWKPEQLIGRRSIDFVVIDDVENSLTEYRRVLHEGGTAPPLEARFRTAGGDLRWMSVLARGVSDGSGAAVVSIRDCQAEVVARRAASTLAAGNGILVRSTNPDELLREMCQIAVDAGGYRFAWYGRAVDDEAQTIAPVAASREWRDYLDEVIVSWGVGPLGQGPSGTAFRTRSTQVVDDFGESPAYTPWRDATSRRGFRSSITLPVVVDGAIDGVFVVYAGEARAFDGQATSVLEHLAAQLGMGLGRLRERDRLLTALRDQALLGAAVDQSAEAVVITDVDGDIVYANPAAIQTSGYSLVEVLGSNPRIFKSGLHDLAFYEAMWARLTSGLSWHGVIVNKRKSGELYEEDATIGPVHDAEGRRIAYVAVKHDLTQQRGLEADLDREVNDRVSVLRLMDRVRPATTLASTATLLCQEIVQLSGLDTAVVVLQEVDGSLFTLSTAGAAVPGVRAGEALAGAALEGVMGLVATGTQPFDLTAADAAERLEPSFVRRLTDLGFTAAGYVDLPWGNTIEGALAVATKSPDGIAQLRSRRVLLEEIGAFAGSVLGPQAEQHARSEVIRAAVLDTIEQRRFHTVFQPIVELTTLEVVGYEALTRFDDGRPPNVHIAEAHSVSLGSDLEAALAAVAIASSDPLPGGTWMSVNFSPGTVVDGQAAEVLVRMSRQTVIEITEHARIESYPAVRHALRQCHGCKVSIDDAGAGYASLHHILELEPDIVKLDIGLVRDIDRDPARQALVAGLGHYANRTGTVLLAEGVETQAEADALIELGVRLGQGYLFGRPAPIH